MRKKVIDQKAMVQVDQAFQEVIVHIRKLKLQNENTEVVPMFQKETKEDDKDQQLENQVLDEEVVLQEENNFYKKEGFNPFFFISKNIVDILYILYII